MKHLLASAVMAAAALAGPAAGSAQQIAYTSKTVNLRAGPDRAYPVVAVLPPSTQVVVQGCLFDYRWCDVAWGYERGWVYAGNLRYPYQSGYVLFPSIAPYIGVVVFSFVFHDYWTLYYRDRPWFVQRDRWAPPPPRPPRTLPPPTVVPAPRVVPTPRAAPPARVQPAPPAPAPRPVPPARVQPQPADREEAGRGAQRLRPAPRGPAGPGEAR